MVSVFVGFLYMFIFNFRVFLVISKPRKFMVFFFVGGVEFYVVMYLIDLSSYMFMRGFAIAVYD